MALDEKRPCLWHAFNALAVQGKGCGVKTQLKVLTHNIGSSLGMNHIENGLEDFHSGKALNFVEYMQFLDLVLFSELSADLKRSDLSAVDEVCWLVCQKPYLQRPGAHVLNADQVYKLWRVFNLCAEITGDGELVYPVSVDCSELDIILARLHSLMGTSYDDEKLQEVAKKQNQKFSFLDFIILLEAHYCSKVQADILTMAINQLYDDDVTQIIKKGFLTKKGHMMSNWKERWFVLTPKQMKYYTSDDENDLKGTIHITKKCRIEILPEKIGARSNRFYLVSEQKTYEISASSALVRTEWLAAFGRAKEECDRTEKLLMKNSRRRRLARQQSEAALQQEEESKRIQRELQAKTDELEAEKQARAQAEAQLQLESEHLKVEQQRLQELEDIRKQLEQLLADERQAKRDEEIVRELQSRILEEEFAKREHLEALHLELENSLAEEHQLREELEDLLHSHQELLEEEEEKLEDGRLQMDRHRAEMEEAKAKLQEAERVKEELLQKLKEKEIVDMKMQAEPVRFTSHRGLGAFAEVEFQVKREKIMKGIQERHQNDEKSDDDLNDKDCLTDDEIVDNNNVAMEDTDTDIPVICSKLGDDIMIRKDMTMGEHSSEDTDDIVGV